MRTTAQFLGIERVDERRWRLPVTDRITGGGRGSLFGGAGLAAGVVALEAETGRPCVWATGQYLSVTGVGDVIDIEVLTPAEGRTVTQGRVGGSVVDREIISVVGAVGERPESHRGVFAVMPEAGDPEDAVEMVREDIGHIHEHIDARIARGMFGFLGIGEPSGDERFLIWLRMKDVVLDSAALALLGDYMPAGIGNALGEVTFCTSLDNTIRIADAPDDTNDGWVLCDSRVEFIGNGFAHGTAHMWSRSGTLLATVSQSVLVLPTA
jgi:acyl-CoA thioesterase